MRIGTALVLLAAIICIGSFGSATPVRADEIQQLVQKIKATQTINAPAPALFSKKTKVATFVCGSGNVRRVYCGNGENCCGDYTFNPPRA